MVSPLGSGEETADYFGKNHSYPWAQENRESNGVQPDLFLRTFSAFILVPEVIRQQIKIIFAPKKMKSFVK